MPSVCAVDLSPRRERLSKGLKPVEEWAVCHWKRSVFQGTHREGKCSVTGGVGWGRQGDFTEQPRVPCGLSTWEEKGGMRFIFTNVPVLHTSCLHLQVKRSLTFKDSPEPPLPMGISGLLDSWAERVDSPLPCDGGCFLFYQQRMSFSKRDFVLYH